MEVDESFTIVCHKKHIPTTQQDGLATQSNPVINYLQPKHNAKWEDGENHVAKKNTSNIQKRIQGLASRTP